MIGTPKQLITKLLNLSEETIYEIKEVKESRTQSQNRLLWELIGLIDKKVNGGRRSKDGDMEIYCDALESSNAKCDIFLIQKDSLKHIKESDAFRAIRILQWKEEKGIKFAVCKCYPGSSKFKKDEMMALIDYVLDIASENDIQTDYWEKLLK